MLLDLHGLMQVSRAAQIAQDTVAMFNGAYLG
jgi:hypothetical protein